MQFKEFDKIYRLSRPCIVTEKIDGTNASVCITEAGDFFFGSRTRWITPTDDNYGFARWAEGNKSELIKLGPGLHYGEWWGKGIQRNYGISEKRFSLFNTSRWTGDAVRPACCGVVPILKEGIFGTFSFDEIINDLKTCGSKAVPGWMKPEGLVCFHVQGNFCLKKTCEKDTEHKSQQK